MTRTTTLEQESFLYAQLRPGLEALARRLGADDPESTASQVLFDCLRRRERLDLDDTAFRAYAYRALRNRVAAEHRSQVPSLVELDEARHDRSEPDHVDRLVGDEDLRALLGSLPPAQRDVVAHRFVGGYSAAETARRLGRSPGAVRRLQHDAIRRIRFLLAAGTVLALLAFVLNATDRANVVVDNTPATPGPAPTVTVPTPTISAATVPSTTIPATPTPPTPAATNPLTTTAGAAASTTQPATPSSAASSPTTAPAPTSTATSVSTTARQGATSTIGAANTQRPDAPATPTSAGGSLQPSSPSTVTAPAGGTTPTGAGTVATTLPPRVVTVAPTPRQAASTVTTTTTPPPSPSWNQQWYETDGSARWSWRQWSDRDDAESGSEADGVAWVAAHSGLCLDIEDASDDAGARLIQWTCHGRANQQFSWQGAALVAAHSELCLEVADGSQQPGAQVVQAPCTGQAHQTIERIDDELVFTHSGQCLDVNRASQRDGAWLIQWPCHGRANQQFTASPTD